MPSFAVVETDQIHQPTDEAPEERQESSRFAGEAKAVPVQPYSPSVPTAVPRTSWKGAVTLAELVG
jgi:hypothetical protein